MSFVFQHLRKINEITPTFWSYWSVNDSTVAVKRRNYFEEARNKFAVGDWIFVSASDGGTILHVDEIDPLEIGALR
jgi:hypothetical protein